MESYPHPYSAVIATFNHQSLLKDGAGELDETDPENLSDDDLVLWVNAQFTFDNQSEKDLEDEMALKIAQNQRQQYEAQRQAQQQQQHQQAQQQHHQQQFQYQGLQQQHLQQPHSIVAPLPQQLHHHQHQQHHQQPQQHQTSHTYQYPAADVQRQLQQIDAIHGYLDVDSEDPRTSLALVERSRQRNPASSVTQMFQQQQQQQTNFDHRHPAYPQQPAPHLLHQPLVTHPQQFHSYTVGTSPLPSPTTTAVHDYQHLQIHPQQGEGIGLTTRNRNNSVGALSSLSLSSPSSTHSTRDEASPFVSHEEKLQRLEDELQEYQGELAEERRLQEQQDPTSPTNTIMDTDDINGVIVASAEYDDGTYLDGGGGSGSQDTRSRSNSLLSRDDPDYVSKLAAEEDKRRRNTAASARFRQKKRLREQILEKIAKEMTAKSELLELRVRELEMEIKWLRGLVVEKDASRVLLEGKSSLTPTPSSPSSSSPSSSTAGLLSGSLPSSFVGPLPNGIGTTMSPTALLNSHLAANADNSTSTTFRRRKAP